ncbi:MAG TPA: IS21 family transposase, partial [Caulobacteraceae bacterium]
MFSVELYGRVRHACHVEGLSLREAARRFGIHRNTVRKMLAFSVPPGYRRREPPARPRLGAFTAIIDRILEDDRSAPGKQRHTAKRIHERLRAEHGFAGGYTVVKDYVRERRARVREVFVPLAHPPGHAQADFGEAVAVVGGVERKVHFFCLDLPHSDAGFVKAYPAERLEAFCDGHNAAFAFFGGVPRSILYDNTRLAVARIRGDGTRERTRGFAELRSHYLFLDRFGRPGKGNDKGKVEGLVGYARRNFLVPVPRVESFAALNAHLERRCLDRLDHRVRGHAESIGERLERDLAALQARPAAPYEACERKAARVSAMSLVRFDRNDYSVPTEYGHRAVLVRGHVEEVVIACGAETIARHPRSYAREDFVFDPLHYLALLERKVGALDQAAPLRGWELPEAFGTLRR